MTLEFKNQISIQPLEDSGSGLQFQNAIYIQPKDEGGSGGGTYNINLVGNVENKNGVLSGFSTENYGYFNNPMGATSSNFEIVVKLKLTSASPSKTVRFFGGNIDANNKLDLYIYNGKIYVSVNTWSMTGKTVLDLNTDYYIKVKLDTTTGFITLYLSTTGEFSGEETIEDTRSKTSAQAIPSIFYAGYIPTNTLAFDFGEIDLNGCYIKDGENLVWQGVTK